MRALLARFFHLESDLTIRVEGWAQLRVKPNLLTAAVVVGIVAAVFGLGVLFGNIFGGEVRAPPAHATPTPLFGWLEGARVVAVDGASDHAAARPGARVPLERVTAVSGPSERPAGGVAMV